MTSRSRITTDRLTRAYPPSWYDRLSEWIDQRPLPSWFKYMLLPILWIGFAGFIQWIEGSGTIQTWEPITFVAIAQIGYVLFICQHLDKLALKALDDFKPALMIEDEHYPMLQRLISTLPANQTRLITLLFSLIGVFLIILSNTVEIDSTLSVDPTALGVVLAVTMVLLWALNGLFVYHAFHQLSVVNYILTQLSSVHPFHQKELFAFSSFSAQTGISLVIMTPLWIILDPGMVSLVISIVFAIFGLIAFISPLIGVHNILVREKDRLLDENAIQIEKTIEDLMIEVKRDRPERLSLADQKLSSLDKARLQIERISTWPWRTETLRQLLAAIFLPIVIWLMQYFLAQLLGS